MAFNVIEDNWKLAPSFTQTSAAKITNIKYTVALFPKKHHVNQYLSALQAIIDVGGKDSTFETFVTFSKLVIKRIRQLVGYS